MCEMIVISEAVVPRMHRHIRDERPKYGRTGFYDVVLPVDPTHIDSMRTTLLLSRLMGIAIT